MDFGFIGSTWWTKKWLTALLQDVESSTLATAKKYLGNNQLVNLQISDNRIISSVRGIHGALHENYIVFPKTEPEKATVLISLLKQQPSEIRALNNNTLNPSLELILNKCGVPIFNTLEKVKMGCDCKDLPPCKYIVTTFLAIAKQMDDNPSILFKIHGIDLDGLKNYQCEAPEITEAPSESSIVHGIRQNGQPMDASGRIPEFNFSEWRDYSRILPAMLPNFPDFCPAGNFRKSFADELEFCRSYYRHFETFQDFSEQFRLYNSKTFMMEGEVLQAFHSSGWNWHFEQSSNGQVLQSNLSVATAMGALCAVSQGNFFMHHFAVRFLHRLFMGAFYFIRTGAIYPQVFWTHKDVAQVRWLPAQMLPDVLAIVAEYEKHAQTNIALTSKDDDQLLLASPAEHILSVFIGQLLRFARKFKPANQKSRHENLLSFFFDCISGKLANNAHTIPGKIQKWFSVYNALDFRAQIVFACAETQYGVTLDVFINPNRTPLSILFENNDSRLLSILSILNGLAESFKPLEAYLERKASTSIMMAGKDLLDFLENSLKKLDVLGIQTEIPKNLMNIKRPKAQMRVQGSLSHGSFKAEDLLDFDWQVALGDEQISAKEFIELAEKAEGLLKFKNQYIQVTEQDLSELREKLEKKNQNDVSQAKLVQACLTGQCENQGENITVTLTAQMKEQIENWRKETEVDLPQNLNAVLRPYQLRGYSWLYKNLDMGFGCILADDMGLGKTLQVITFLLKLKQEGKLEDAKALVVVPAGLLCNWQMELRKFAPELTFFAYHGGSRDLQKFKSHILLTTYATFRRDADKLKSYNWKLVIIDEAQNIKNADSDQSRLLRSIQSPMKIAMSGTPVENRLMEFWTIMDFCNRGILPHASEFHEKFEVPIQKNQNAAKAELFSKITEPFMLRRLKTDKSIIDDLPDKIIQDEYAELTKSQAMLYKATLDKFMTELEAEELSAQENSLFKRKGIILQMILALKQICNHPATYLKLTENP